MTGDRTLATLIKQLYGVATSPLLNSFGGSVGATAIVIAGLNPRRVGLTITNNSLNTLWILPSPLVSATVGIYVAPGGGQVTFRWDIDFELISNEWYGVCPAGASSVTVLENIAL
jgi:hypothetical protein